MADHEAADWPFWAPSQQAAVAEALDLAGLRTGESFIDLGCGDGRVVAEAAGRGAIARGIEADSELVDQARDLLDEAGVDAAVSTGDLFDSAIDLHADVLFSYLAPATLQRLLPRLAPMRGSRLVTVDFDVPGLVPTRRGDAARLYRLPGRRRHVGAPGWPCAGTLVATVPGYQSLTCLEAIHPGGRVRLSLSSALKGTVTALAGAQVFDGPSHLAIDLRWEERDAGTFVAGTIRLTGMEDHHIFVIFSDDDEGVWELDTSAVDRLQKAARRVRPTTAREALAVLEEEPAG